MQFSDLPDSCDLKSEKIGDWYNLTCSLRNGRPKANITWYMNDFDITDYAYHPEPELDENGSVYCVLVSLVCW